MRPQLDRLGITGRCFLFALQCAEGPSADYPQPWVLRWCRAVNQLPGLPVAHLPLQVIPPPPIMPTSYAIREPALDPFIQILTGRLQLFTCQLGLSVLMMGKGNVDEVSGLVPVGIDGLSIADG